jgi:hypothetical protein
MISFRREMQIVTSLAGSSALYSGIYAAGKRPYFSPSGLKWLKR